MKMNKVRIYFLVYKISQLIKMNYWLIDFLSVHSHYRLYTPALLHSSQLLQYDMAIFKMLWPEVKQVFLSGQ